MLLILDLVFCHYKLIVLLLLLHALLEKDIPKKERHVNKGKVQRGQINIPLE